MRAYLGLGSNLDNPITQVRSALSALNHLPHTTVVAISSLYRSKPLAQMVQPDYVNAVVALQTQLSPFELLLECQQIERQQGRVRHQRWGSRTIDLDVLLYGDEIIQSDRLTIPHPGIPLREFVLYPLAELNSELVIPGVGPLSLLCETVPNTMERIL